MRLKQLEGVLQDVAGFRAPKLLLEQYETPCHIAAHMAFTAEFSFGDLTGKAVADLGCGCGMLSIASAVLGAASVTG